MPVILLNASGQVCVFFVLQELVIVAYNGGLAGFGVEAEVADIFDDSAQVVLILADQLDIFLLLVDEDTGLILFAGKLAFELGNAGGLSLLSVIGPLRVG